MKSIFKKIIQRVGTGRWLNRLSPVSTETLDFRHCGAIETSTEM